MNPCLLGKSARALLEELFGVHDFFDAIDFVYKVDSKGQRDKPGHASYYVPAAGSLFLQGFALVLDRGRHLLDEFDGVVLGRKSIAEGLFGSAHTGAYGLQANVDRLRYMVDLLDQRCVAMLLTFDLSFNLQDR